MSDKDLPFLLIVLVGCVLYFLLRCRHKYVLSVSNQVGDMFRCEKCSKRVVVRRRRGRG